jgi:hypothetical protein
LETGTVGSFSMNVRGFTIELTAKKKSQIPNSDWVFVKAF